MSPDGYPATPARSTAGSRTMSKNNKGMICFLHPWEWEDYRVTGVRPDCRNHRHITRRRAFELTGDTRYAARTLANVFDTQQLIGFIVEVAGRTRWCQKRGTYECKVIREGDGSDRCLVPLSPACPSALLPTILAAFTVSIRPKYQIFGFESD